MMDLGVTFVIWDKIWDLAPRDFHPSPSFIRSFGLGRIRNPERSRTTGLSRSRDSHAQLVL